MEIPSWEHEALHLIKLKVLLDQEIISDSGQ